MPAGPWIAGRAEAAGLHGRLVLVQAQVVQGRERHRAVFALGARFGAIGEDGEEPGLERRAAFEAGQALEHGQPGFLRHFFGHGLLGHVQQGHAHQAGVAAVDPAGKGCFVPLAQRG